MNEIETWLESRIGLNFRSGLERMRQAISLLDHPERKLSHYSCDRNERKKAQALLL